MAKEKAKEINLGEGLGAVSVILNCKRIEIGANGNVDGIEPVGGNTTTSKEINLGEGLGAAAITVNGKRIEISEEGVVTGIQPANGNTVPVTVVKAAPEVGELTKDGLYIGRFADDPAKGSAVRDYYAAPTDAQDSNGKRLSLSFNKAVKYAKNATDLGHNDWALPRGYVNWRVPNVLRAMFNNRSTGAFKDTFDEKGLSGIGGRSSLYWSSSPDYTFLNFFGQFMDFKDGKTFKEFRSMGLSVRLVRSVEVFKP